jgi:hypothetical protein
MPKKRKTSRKNQKAISKEIQTLLREYKETGKFHTSRAEYKPRSIEHARRIASRIAYEKYGVSKDKKKRKKK